MKLKDHEYTHHKHRMPIFGVRLEVIVANDFAPLWAHLFPAHIPQVAHGAIGSAWFDSETRTAYVGLRTEANCQTIAHEALHITHRLLADIGQDPDYVNDEVECYLHGYIVLHLTPSKKDKRRQSPLA